MNLRKVIIVMFYLSFTVGCEEVFYPDDIETDKDIFIVEAYIDDGPGPYRVNLSYALPFTSGENSIPVCCATVRMSDDHGNTATLNYEGGGRYSTGPGDIQGVPGRKYKLYIRLPNGNVYESSEEMMPEPITTGEIFAELGIKKDISRNAYGELIVRELDGLFFYYVYESSEPRYIRFNVSSVYQHIITVSLMGPVYYNIFCWRKEFYNEFPIIAQTQFTGEHEEISDFELGFLMYRYDATLATDTSTAPSPAGWVVMADIHSINENAYQFNHLINEQLQAENHFFDPIPSQINGNIQCINNPDELVTGFFEVSAKTRINKYFRWSRGSDIIRARLLEDYIEPSIGGCIDSIAPPFWIDL